MKRNLILFGIFIFLVVLTYFFQEKRSEKEYSEALTADRLIDFEVKHLKLPGVEATKKHGQWWSGDILLSHNTFKQIEKKLSEIKRLKRIEGEWKTYFPNPFTFEINNEPWTIGDLSLDKQAFYIGHDRKIYLAEIVGESHQLTRDASEIASIKLNELVTALSKPLKDLKEVQLFRFFDLPLKRVVLEVDGNLPFELNFEDNMTEPRPIEGVNPHRDLLGKFYSLLTQIMIKEEVPYNYEAGFKKLASLKFMEDKKILTWELWLKNKTSADAIIINPETKRAWSVIGGTLRLFFVRIQDYWDKKVIPQEDFQTFTRLPATFTQGDKKAEVIILNREPLSFEVKGYKVDQLKMEQLVQFIFNLGPKDQGERVSNLSKSERKQVLSGDHLRVEVMDQELLLWRKPQELIVVNLTQGYKVHFNLLDENFSATFQDMLK